MALDPTFQAALEADAPTIFYAAELLLPSSVTIRLLDTGGTVTFSAKTFTGEDATYGTLAELSEFQDGIGVESPVVSLSIFPPSNAAAATLAASANQGSAVNIWMGAVNASTGAVIGTPELMFAGEIDVTEWVVDRNTRMVRIDVVSVFERLFETDEGLTLTDASHQDIYSGETGFEMVTNVLRQLPWGADAPRPQLIATRSNGGVVTGGDLIWAGGGITGIAARFGAY